MDGRDEPYATRREVDQVRDELRTMRSDSTTIAVLAQQITQLTANLLDFKTSVYTRFDAHDKLHATAEQERVSSRAGPHRDVRGRAGGHDRAVRLDCPVPAQVTYG